MSRKTPFSTAFRHELSARFTRLQHRIAENRPVEKGAFRGIVAGVWIRIEPRRITPYASTNRNRAEPLPRGAGWQSQSATVCRRRFEKAGIQKYFLWLSPSPAAERIERDLLAAGFRQIGVRYPVLARRAKVLPLPPTSFIVRRFNWRRDARVFRDYPDADMRTRILRPIRIAGLEHFVAWDGPKPVAVASLFVHRGLGYLHNGSTLPERRRRGAQSALIAARVNQAAKKGCDWVISETVLVRKTSFSNLQRLGFDAVFEKKVFRPDSPRNRHKSRI